MTNHPSMSGTVERVARALFEHEWSAFETKPEYEWESHKDYWLSGASIAIEASNLEMMRKALVGARRNLRDIAVIAKAGSDTHEIATQGANRIGTLCDAEASHLSVIEAENKRLREALLSARSTFDRLTLICPHERSAVFLQASAEIGAIDEALSEKALSQGEGK